MTAHTRVCPLKSLKPTQYPHVGPQPWTGNGPAAAICRPAHGLVKSTSARGGYYYSTIAGPTHQWPILLELGHYALRIPFFFLTQQQPVHVRDTIRIPMVCIQHRTSHPTAERRRRAKPSLNPAP